MVKEAIKKQFDKKRWNPQGLKEGDNMWLKVKRYLFELTLKEVGPEKIWIFQNCKGYWTRSVSTKTTRRMGDS